MSEAPDKTEVEILREIINTQQRRLNERDSFIWSLGLWDEFIAALAARRKP